MSKDLYLYNFKDVILEFKNRFNLQELNLDSEGNFSLLFDECHTVKVSSFPNWGLFYFYSFIPSISMNQKNVRKNLLEISFIHPKSYGGYFALSNESNLVVFVRSMIFEGLTVDIFEENLNRFVDSLEYWTDQILATGSIKKTQPDRLEDRIFKKWEFKV